MESGENKIQLFHRKSRGSAATKKDCFEAAVGYFVKAPIEIQQERIEEGLSFVSVGRFFVEAAIRTGLWTKGNVEVKVVQSGQALNSVLDLHKGEYNAASWSSE